MLPTTSSSVRTLDRRFRFHRVHDAASTLVASDSGSCSVRTKNVMAAAGTLRSRDEDRLADGAVQRRPDVADDADDRPLHVVSAVGVVDVDAQAPAERAAIGELLPHELLADDRDGRRVDGVGVGEIASGHLRNPQRLEEPRRDRPDLARRQLAVRRLRPIDAPEAGADARRTEPAGTRPRPRAARRAAPRCATATRGRSCRLVGGRSASPAAARRRSARRRRGSRDRCSAA